MNQTQKQVVMTKLAQVRLAVNYVLRTRVMQKQAEGPYKKPVYSDPYDSYPYPKTHSIIQEWSRPEDAVIRAGARKEWDEGFNRRYNNPSLPPYMWQRPNALAKQLRLERPEKAPFTEPVSAAAVERTIKNRGVVGDPYLTSQPHHLNSNDSADDSEAYMIQAFDADSRRAPMRQRMLNQYRGLYGGDPNFLSSPEARKKYGVQ